MRFLRVLALSVFVVACSSQKKNELNLVVAASAGPAAEKVAELLAKKDIKVRVQSGASSLIARQIDNGMDCDVVITADNDWMDFLDKHDRIESGSRRPFLGNELVWAVRKEYAAQKESRVAVANPDHVPAGKYAKRELQARGRWDDVAKKVVAAPDVRTALLWLEKGEVDSAIIYASDAQSSSKVVVRERLESKTDPIIFPIAQCRSKNARVLYDALHRHDVAEIFKKSGFRIVSP